MQVSEMDEVQREFYEERAGILEYEANMPRAMAEELALEMTKEFFKCTTSTTNTQAN